MAYLKVVVPLLNKRKSPVEDPSDKSNIIGQVNKDFQFESIAEESNVLGKWYKDRDGYYYWGGGVREVIDYNKLLQNIPENIRNTQGENVTIAIIDSGCANSYEDLNAQIIARYDAYEPSTNTIDKSVNSHGTFISGLLIANNEIKGICSKSRLIIIRAVDSAVDKTVAIKNGLLWLLDNYKNEVNIVSMSLGFEPGIIYGREIEDILNKFNQDTFFIAAGGDNDKLFEDVIWYPARHDLFTCVGVMDQDLINANSISKINRKVKYIFPDFNYISYSKDKGLKSDQGSSFATAILSGVLSLIISGFKTTARSYTKTDILNICDHFAGNINADEFSNNILKQYTL
jgi:subtilisin family serine protease